MSVIKNATINCGYYHIDAIAGLPGEHTYAYIDHFGIRFGFPCFGGFSEYEGEYDKTSVAYPSDIWEWSILTITCKNLGRNLPANLFMALAMAQYTLAPEILSFSVDSWKTYWNHSDVKDDRGLCHAGIEYALTGVCHQACNRILTAATYPMEVMDWPASFNVTRHLYGAHGDLSWGISAKPFIKELSQRAQSLEHIGINKLASAPQSLNDIAPELAEVDSFFNSQDHQKLNDNHLKNHLQTKVNSESEEAQWTNLLLGDQNAAINEFESVEAREPSRSDIKEIGKVDSMMRNTKKELDIQLIRGEISRMEYASQVNQLVSCALEDYRRCLSPDNFNKIFPGLDQTEVAIIDADLLRESYEFLQERLSL